MAKCLEVRGKTCLVEWQRRSEDEKGILYLRDRSGDAK
jgi:hypothetical protein